MNDLIWKVDGSRAAVLTRPTRFTGPAARIVEAVRDGRAGRMFPVEARPGDDGVLRVGRPLGGAADASLVAQLFSRHRFAPLVNMLAELDVWCRRATRRFSDVVSSGVLSIDNADLFGPLVTEVFVACAARSGSAADRIAVEQRARFEVFLALFLVRLRRDARSVWFDEAGYRLPVVGLHAHDAESHNDGQRVLRLDFTGGRRLAYKPRPAGGELLFLAESGSVFDVLNRLPAASGQVRLPTLRCQPGSGAGGYLWQEWVERPAQWATIRRSGNRRLLGTRLGTRQADRFWHRVGSLAAACFAFGIADLGEGNVLTGTAPGDTEPMLYPVDLEVYFTDTRRLHDTGLIAGPNATNHHCGLENAARWCTVEGPLAYFERTVGAGLRLHRRRSPWAREQTRSVVADSAGRVGYGAHLAAFLRGMFDAWTLMCRNRDRLREILRQDSYVRLLLRPSAVYGEELDDRLLSSGSTQPEIHFGTDELVQLDRMDVPYFFRSAAGGPVLRWDQTRETPVSAAVDVTAGMCPIAEVRRGERLTLAGLGAALRDAVEYVFTDLDRHTAVDPEHGVRMRFVDAQCGEVSFDWLQVGRRVTYRWDGRTVRLLLERLEGATELVPEVRRRLLRLDRVNAALRHRGTDEAVHRQLRVLTDRGAAWLRDVIGRYGWPGRALVGPRAADAACRLVQHLDDQVGFQRECLTLVHAAAESGDVPWRHVAYLTDAIRVLEGRPQVYGTKFRRHAGMLVPHPIEQPDEVDARRRRLGMEPLNRYARRLRDRFTPAEETA